MNKITVCELFIYSASFAITFIISFAWPLNEM